MTDKNEEQREDELEEEETVTEDEEESQVEDTESDEDEQSEEEEEEDIDWKERALKAEKVIEMKKKEAKKKRKESKSSDDDVILARLESRGVMEKEDQEYVLKYANVEGISPIEALNESLVQDKLSHFEKKRKSKAASKAPGNRTGGSSDDVDKWVRRYKKDGSLPDNPRLVSQVLDKLKEE